MKIPFKVGDRVKVYGNWKPTVCVIQDIRDSGMLSTDECGLVHSKQCRRLKAKTKPQRPRNFWISNPSGPDTWSCYYNFPGLANTFEYTALLPNEIVITRAIVKLAWDKITAGDKYTTFDTFCERLGLPKEHDGEQC